MLEGFSRRMAAPAIVVALLAAAVCASAALAWQAHEAERAQRRIADRVLHDYVEFAGWEYARATRRDMDMTFDRWLASASSRVSAQEGCECDAPILFAVRASADGAILSASGAVPPAFDAWLRRVAGTLHPRGPRVADVITIDGRAVAVAARTGHGPTAPPHQIVAVAADPAPLQQALSRALRQAPLLPPTLTGFSNEMLGVRVRSRDGIPLVTPASFPDGPVARATLDDSVGGFSFDIALHAAAADRLVIGGLAPSRLPWLLGLLALTAGLLVIAGLQLRREHELAKCRADFVSSVTHELRTPLAQIRLFTETMLLDRVRSADEARRSLQIVHQEAQRLGHLVENVLYFSRGEHHAHRIAKTPVHLPSAADELIQSFAPLAESGRRARLELDVREDVIAPVDPGAFRQVLLNLLDNAVKYGPADQTVRVSIDRRGSSALVVVEDEGPGIDPADRERIWQPYARLTPAASSAVTGAGIGLSVVRDLVELHGGRVSVGAGGRGARFEVALPA